MSDQASNTQTTTEQPVAVAHTQDAPAQAAASIDPAEFARAMKEIGELRKEAADRRIKAKESEEGRLREEAAKIEAQKKAGEFAPVVAAHEARIRELEASLASKSPMADAYAAELAERKASIESDLPSLPEWARPAISAALKHGEIGDAFKALSQFKASQAGASVQAASPPPTKPAPNGAAPTSPAKAIDWADGSLANLTTLKAADPERFAQMVRGYAAGSQSGGFSLSRLTGRGGRKQ